MIQDVECAQCGAVCGSWDSGKISGPPETCYPPEYVSEPDFCDDNGHDFCSQECMDEYAAKNTSDPDDETDDDDLEARP